VKKLSSLLCVVLLVACSGEQSERRPLVVAEDSLFVATHLLQESGTVQHRFIVLTRTPLDSAVSPVEVMLGRALPEEYLGALELVETFAAKDSTISRASYDERVIVRSGPLKVALRLHWVFRDGDAAVPLNKDVTPPAGIATYQALLEWAIPEIRRISEARPTIARGTIITEGS